ncbi:MAG: histidine phosphatase family protein [Rothia sp. (in: high G+C Gram-positive bacteria)]|uniref:histidine phosphatase family protein n=1 Tax=Rothia sp. (in: high G+C Gram-positive bacteria) TaxID=1885016 RepID=UPI0026FDE21D|nr:histidine phosphatase family protein [Rothia sp. (in: high G+C Gram-positive bacteria)]
MNTSSATVTVHLMRHGEVHNPDRIVYGRLPNYHLSETGQKMVRLSAEEFKRRADAGANIVHLVCSPLTRTRESAAPIEELLGLRAQPDERVIEAGNYFEGLHVNKDELLKNPRHWKHLLNPLRPSWGEPYRDQVARMAEAIKDAARTAYEKGGDGAEAIIVSHQLPIWMARTSVEGGVLPHDPRSRQCNLASITSFTFPNVFAPGKPKLSYVEPAAELYSGVIQLPGS